MKTKFKDFLEDNNSNDFIFQTVYNNLKIHKEKYNDRFIVIYSKAESKGLKQEEYSVSGYYDIIDKVLYNSSYDIRDLIPTDNSIKVDSFDNVVTKMCQEIDDYIADYILSNSEKYRKLGQEKYDNLDHWRRDGAIQEVERVFIEDANPSLKMASAGSGYKIRYQDNFYNKSIIVDYLNNPKGLIKKYATEFIDKDKEDLGMDLLIYEHQLEYLDKIIKNKNHEFDYIYINKKLIESIKDVDAKNLNITINYNGNEITFKYEFNRLLSELKGASYKGYDYNSNYEKVREFLKENNIKDDRGYQEDSFSFKNITSITYGKKILYEKQILNQEKEIENDDFDLEK